MSDFLVSHALSNVWCTPDQDNQLIVQPARLTPINGVWGSWRVMWTTMPLPEPTARFHLYKIGQVHPVLLTLFAKTDRWVSLAQACVVGKNICDFYTRSGLQLARSQVWYQCTRDNNVILAVKKQPRTPYDFNTLELYLRVYSNAYFDSSRAALGNNFVDVQGGVMDSVPAILALQARWNTASALPGGAYGFVNGVKVGSISLVNVAVGDTAEFVYDSSIRRVIDYKLSDLPTFDSTLDSKGKYLLHYGGLDDASIDFLDDIDIFLVDSATQRGIYVHKNAADTLRMLSHRDYAIPVAYVAAYLSHFEVDGALDMGTLYLRLHVRNSGYQRALILEHHRLNELYKLADADISAALLGVNAVVPVWQAQSLEMSDYVRIMRSPCCDITREMVQSAYGYHAAAKLAANTPQAVTVNTRANGDVKIVMLPYLLTADSTVFEYDAQGLLLEWHRHVGGQTYLCRNAQTATIEAVVGEGGYTLDEVYNQSATPLVRDMRYRFYRAPVVNGDETSAWEDVTGSSVYGANAGSANWLPDPTYHTLVRSDRRFLLYRFSAAAPAGVLLFTLTSESARRGIRQMRNLEVPLGELDVFLNRHSLVRGVDYFVQFPHIAIVNKEYLVGNPQTTAQDIVVRFTGFCDAALKETPVGEFGFVQQGRLSVNHRFDIHDGRVSRIVCGGRLRTQGDLVFAEETQTYDFVNENNGAPYSVRDMVVPMRDLVDADTYVYRSQSLAVDKSVSDYLSTKLPEANPTGVNPLLGRYQVYSPFVCKIMYALLDNHFDATLLAGHYSNEQVRTLCAPYEYLLAFDPIHIDNALNPDYVVVHPHNLTTEVGLDLARYRFLNRVVQLYANGTVSLTSFIKLV